MTKGELERTEKHLQKLGTKQLIELSAMLEHKGVQGEVLSLVQKTLDKRIKKETHAD